MSFPAFSAGHFQEINRKENAVRGAGRVCLWNNRRIKETEGHHDYIVKKSLFIPIK